MIDTIHETRCAVFIVVATTRCGVGGGRTCSRGEIRAKGRKEVLAGHNLPIYLKLRHVLLGVLGVEIFEIDGRAVIKLQREVIGAIGTAHRHLIGREIKDKASIFFRSNCDALTVARLNKSDVSHTTISFYQSRENIRLFLSKRDKLHKRLSFWNNGVYGCSNPWLGLRKRAKGVNVEVLSRFLRERDLSICLENLMTIDTIFIRKIDCLFSQDWSWSPKLSKHYSSFSDSISKSKDFV